MKRFETHTAAEETLPVPEVQLLPEWPVFNLSLLALPALNLPVSDSDVSEFLSELLQTEFSPEEWALLDNWKGTSVSEFLSELLQTEFSPKEWALLDNWQGISIHSTPAPSVTVCSHLTLEQQLFECVRLREDKLFKATLQKALSAGIDLVSAQQNNQTLLECILTQEDENKSINILREFLKHKPESTGVWTLRNSPLGKVVRDVTRRGLKISKNDIRLLFLLEVVKASYKEKDTCNLLRISWDRVKENPNRWVQRALASAEQPRSDEAQTSSPPGPLHTLYTAGSFSHKRPVGVSDPHAAKRQRHIKKPG